VGLLCYWLLTVVKNAGGFLIFCSMTAVVSRSPPSPPHVPFRRSSQNLFSILSYSIHPFKRLCWLSSYHSHLKRTVFYRMECSHKTFIPSPKKAVTNFGICGCMDGHVKGCLLNLLQEWCCHIEQRCKSARGEPTSHHIAYVSRKEEARVMNTREESHSCRCVP
jgi:hypothetical protein